MTAVYLARRLLQVPPLLLAIGTAVFLMLRLVPGDPAELILGIRATPESVVALRHQMGFDRPLPVQYVTFVSHLLRGDLGTSVIYVRPVRRLIAERMPATIELVAYAAVLTAFITGPVSIAAALQRGRSVDRTIVTACGVGLALPSFWLGTMLLLMLGLRLRWFPIGGYGTGPQQLRYLFLPALTLAVPTSSLLIRNLRSAILGVMQADYVRTAHAKGAPLHRIMRYHVLRNALLSTVTLFAARLGYLIGNTVVVESVFAVPGMGSLMVHAIYGRDYPVVQGITLVFATLVVLMSLATDMVYALLDPRVRYA